MYYNTLENVHRAFLIPLLPHFQNARPHASYKRRGAFRLMHSTEALPQAHTRYTKARMHPIGCITRKYRVLYFEIVVVFQWNVLSAVTQTALRDFSPARQEDYSKKLARSVRHAPTLGANHCVVRTICRTFPQSGCVTPPPRDDRCGGACCQTIRRCAWRTNPCVLPYYLLTSLKEKWRRFII